MPLLGHAAMNFESGLFGIACASVALAIAFLFLVHRRAARQTATLVQTAQDLHAELGRLSNEMVGKITELENVTNKLKIECAATNIQLVSLKAQTDEMAASKAVLQRPKETWVRREDPGNISTIASPVRSAEGDTWVRRANEPKRAEPTDSAARLATLFAQGNAVSDVQSTEQRRHRGSLPRMTPAHLLPFGPSRSAR